MIRRLLKGIIRWFLRIFLFLIILDAFSFVTNCIKEGITFNDIIRITKEEINKSDSEELKSLINEKTNNDSNIQQKELSNLEVHYIDVGQGDCVLIQLNGESMLIDAGNNDKGTLVQKYLMDNNVYELTYVISTHGDADHCGGLDVVLEKFPTKKVLLSYLDHDTRTYEDVKNVITSKRIPTEYPIVGDTYEFNDANITFVGPYENETDSNAASLAFTLNYGNITYLFCGDSETIEINNKNVDVLMCPHHGSYSGNNIENQLNYKYAIISCSGIDYGHPHDSTVSLLKQRNIPLFRTDKQGTIISYCNGIDISWNCNPCNDYSQGLN